MLKRNKKIIILTAIITLLPILMGLILLNQLPDQIATHFGFNGQPDGWSSKPFAVFGLPAILVAAHLLCTLGTAADPRKQNIPDKMLHLVLWICPVISLITNGSIYLIAIGKPINIELICMVLVCIMFIILGNYLPKCRQNYTMGIKLPWTLADEENWNKTHRMAGWLWMVEGVIFLATAVIGKMTSWFFLSTIAVTVLVPTVYSFLLHLKGQKAASRGAVGFAEEVLGRVPSAVLGAPVLDEGGEACDVPVYAPQILLCLVGDDGKACAGGVYEYEIAYGKQAELIVVHYLVGSSLALKSLGKVDSLRSERSHHKEGGGSSGPSVEDKGNGPGNIAFPVRIYGFKHGVEDAGCRFDIVSVDLKSSYSSLVIDLFPVGAPCSPRGVLFICREIFGEDNVRIFFGSVLSLSSFCIARHF